MKQGLEEEAPAAESEQTNRSLRPQPGADLQTFSPCCRFSGGRYRRLGRGPGGLWCFFPAMPADTEPGMSVSSSRPRASWRPFFMNCWSGSPVFFR